MPTRFGHGVLAQLWACMLCGVAGHTVATLLALEPPSATLTIVDTMASMHGLRLSSVSGISIVGICSAEHTYDDAAQTHQSYIQSSIKIRLPSLSERLPLARTQLGAGRTSPQCV